MATRNGSVPSPDDPLLKFKPVPHRAARRNSITADRQRAFIEQLAATGIVTQAAKHIGASLEALYKLRKRPGAEAFAEAWDRAVDCGVARLEDSALARAIEGEERMIVSAGKVLGTERRFNDALVMFFLRNRRPDRYGNGLVPGSPAFERLRQQVMDEYLADQPGEAEILDSLNAKLAAIRERSEATGRMLRDEGARDPGDWRNYLSDEYGEDGDD